MTNFIHDASIKISYQGSTSRAIERAISRYKRDMEKVFIKKDTQSVKCMRLIKDDSLSLIEEQYQLIVEETSIEIQAIDERGLIYGLVHLSQDYLGIQPFWFFNDQVVEKKDSIAIPIQSSLSQPAKVRYRGWFINDEVLLSSWKYGQNESEKWEMVFEALLRCNGNMVIPGTDLTNQLTKTIANQMGLMITHHHAEPLGAEMFHRVYPEKEASFVTNRELFIDLWRQAIIQQKDQAVIWNIGFRGQGDRPFWADDPRFKTDQERGRLISDIIQIQYDLIKDYQENPICCVNLYGEVTDLYQKGYLTLPDQVIKVWADSGYGKMVSRRQGGHNPRTIAKPDQMMTGLHGIYYHVTFYDLQASNHLTMFPNSLAFMKDELVDAFNHRMDEFLIVNAGNIRPHQYQLSFMSQLWQSETVDPTSFSEAYFKEHFKEHAQAVQLLTEDYQDAIIAYGQYPDERAGEQLYYYAIRYLSHAWLTGQSSAIDRLNWLTGHMPSLAAQVSAIQTRIEPYLERWQKLYDRSKQLLDLETTVGQRIYNQIYLQIAIHHHGIQALYGICQSFHFDKNSNFLESFMSSSLAYQQVDELVSLMTYSTHDKWQGFYDNDCLTNVSLVRDIVQTVRGYIRLKGDGPHYYSWEKTYLTDRSERSVELLTNKTKQLSDDELYMNMKKRLEREE